MALDPFYCRGSKGEVVAALQRALMKQQVPREDGTAGTEPALSQADGDFGIATQRAVQRVQSANNLLMTGVVDRATWALLMKPLPWPDLFERMLYALAGFEGHFYSTATGDRLNDRVGMTWGLLGFTLVQVRGGKGNKGPLCELLEKIYAQQRNLVDDAFGVAPAKQLEKALQLDALLLHQFAVTHISSADGKTIRSPWLEGFKKLGENEVIREMQRSFSKTKYWEPAQKLASKLGAAYGMECERTVLFVMDVLVNNGSFLSAEISNAEAAIKQLLAAQPGATVAQKLQCITEAMAKNRPDYAVDIRARKGAIALGYGYVHKIFSRLEGWAIDVSEPVPAQPEGPSLTVLGLDQQSGEQLALAAATRKLFIGEEPAAVAVAEPRFPANTGYELLQSPGVRSVSMRGLAGKGAAILNDRNIEHYDAAQMLFRGKIGVLAISGQGKIPLKGNHYVMQQSGRTYAGLMLKENDQLMLLRQRGPRTAPSESTVDITDLRGNLRDCALLMLYSGYGIPGKSTSLPGSGPRWQAWLKAAGAEPIVLGWFGNASSPRDGQKQTVADVFLQRVGQLIPGTDLVAICKARPLEVIEQWGQACHQVFSGSHQKYLWLDEPLPQVPLTASGAAAIDPTGKVWRANPQYKQSGQLPAMIAE